MPLSNQTLTKWFICICSITCALSIYGSYLQFRARYHHKFAISQAEMAYSIGKGRSGIVFMHCVQLGQFVFNAGIYLNLVSRVIIGLNCQFRIIPAVIDKGIWYQLPLIVVIAVLMWALTYKVLKFRVAKVWSKIICLAFVLLSLLTFSMFVYTIFNTRDIPMNQCLNNMFIKQNPNLQDNAVQIELLTVFYMLPLVNFLFLSQAPYQIPMH